MGDPGSSMGLTQLGTVLLLLLLPGTVPGQDSCDALPRGDETKQCCNMAVEQKERGDGHGLTVELPHRCMELRHSGQPACRCLRARWLRMVQFAEQSSTAGLRALHLNISRDKAQDLLLAFSPAEGPAVISSAAERTAGTIRLPSGVFPSLSSQAVRVVVTVLNIQQLAMFQEDNQMGKVLDDTVVGIVVGDGDISELQDPVQLTFTYQLLPHNVTPICVFWEPSKGQAGGWSSHGCVTQPGDKETVCACDHLSFFTLLLNPSLDRTVVQTLVAVANAGCGVAVAFSIFTFAFYLFLRWGVPAAPQTLDGFGDECGATPGFGKGVPLYLSTAVTLPSMLVPPLPHAPLLPAPSRCNYKQFRSEDTLRVNLGLHMNLVSSLLLLNLAFLLNSGLSSRASLGLCSALGGLTHYCLLCCFTWTALEGCHLYLLFVKVLGTYIHHYLLKLCVVGWGFPALLVVVAGAVGSYGEYSIGTMDHQTIIHLCWINSEHLLVHYITNCGYFGLIFLFNTVIFGVVAWKNCHLWRSGVMQGPCKAWKVALSALGLFCLLGATWALSFLSYSSSSAPILFLAAILNSLQGVFIFIWLVVLYYPRAVETSSSLSHIVRNDRTMAVSQG
ncbi:adhesion G protein-coupled receptor G3 [Coturnix japonica]|uniref:adhesion G protein-coupled receptor G3 n=1 Tax=Coturnix japonica TaxID=93934 RepID=UPI000777EDBB|nr:adhesion G protein-coupled receptor G3 [Coturnix japonica]